jgi:hypothetical protein
MSEGFETQLTFSADREKGKKLSRKLYPVISMQGESVRVRVEFDNQQFSYDLNGAWKTNVFSKEDELA